MDVLTPTTIDGYSVHRIVQGVETDERGKVVAYWICSRHPLAAEMQDGATTWTRVQARGDRTGRRNVLHIMQRERAGQVRGVPVLAIVNVVGSSIARAADYVMYTYAGPEIAVASTKAYMVQMCVLYLFALRLAYARGRLSEAETRRYTAQLLRAPEIIKARLADCEQIKYLASRYMNTQSCFFIGRGFDYSLSLEGSLKLKEISYVHSDAYAAGELKHGTISLITDGVPVIALATQKQVYEKTISNAKETRSRGARVLLFTTKDAVVPEDVADAVIRLDEYEDILMPLQLIVPLLRELDLLQFLPCFLSKGNDVLHRITVLAFETVQQIQPLFDLIQLGVVRVVGIQPVDQLCRCVLGRIVQVHQRAGHPGK